MGVINLIKYNLLLFFVICITLQTNGQSINTDSLLSVWNNKDELDTNRLIAIQGLSNSYLRTYPDSAFYFAQLQYEYAENLCALPKLDTNLGKYYMAKSRNTQGVTFIIRGEFIKAIKYFNNGLELSKAIGDDIGIASCYGNIGIIYSLQGIYSKAIDSYNKSLVIKERLGNKKGIANTLGNIGTIYLKLEDYTRALTFELRCLKIEKEIGDNREMATTFIDVGSIYFAKGDSAKKVHNQNLANNFFIKALEYYNNAYDLSVKNGEVNQRSTITDNIGKIKQRQGKYEEALGFYRQSYEDAQETEDSRGQSSSLYSISRIYYLQKKYSKAIQYGKEALTISKKIGAAEEIQDAAGILYDIYKVLGKYHLALDMYEYHILMRDSIRSIDNKKEVIRQEYEYSFEKQTVKDSIEAAEHKKITDAKITAQKAQLKQEKTQRYSLYGGLALLFLFGGFMYNRFRVTRKQKTIIEFQKSEVEKQRELAINERKEAEYQKTLVEEKNTEITDSINYAKRIQSAILPSRKVVKEYLKKSFILYKPKDIVAGDFYWMEAPSNSPKGGEQISSSSGRQVGAVILFAAADCTGHGVPGAMVSVVCNNALNRSVREHGLTDPGEILNKTRELVVEEFNRSQEAGEKSEEEVKDGMDIALCALTLPPMGGNGGGLLQYAGANNPLWLIRNNELIETKADKQPIGKFDNQTPYTTHTFELQKGDAIYIFSDGYADQFEGPKGKKFKNKAFQELLLSVQNKAMEEQRIIINETFETWRGSLEQIDDVCVIGVRL